jgi:integrase
LELPLSAVAAEIITKWRAIKSCPYVFYNQITGDRFKDVKAGLKKAVKDAGLTGITWHTFRHTWKVVRKREVAEWSKAAVC